MAKKYGGLYVAKQVAKGLTSFGVGLLTGSMIDNYCTQHGFGRVATTTAKIAAFNVGGMISWKTSEFIEDSVTRIQKSLEEVRKDGR